MLKRKVVTDPVTGQQVTLYQDPFTGQWKREKVASTPSATRYLSGMSGFSGDAEEFTSRGITPTIGEDIVETRAQQQSGMDQLANGLIKAGTTFGTATLDNTVGYAAGLLDYAFSGFEDFAGSMSNNVISQYITNPINEGMREAFPNYKTQKEVDEMGTLKGIFNVNFLADEFANGLAYSAASIASMYLTGGSGLATKALSRLPNAIAKSKPVAQMASAAFDVERGILNSSRGAAISAFGKGAKTAFGAAERGLNMSMAEAGLEARDAALIAKETALEKLREEKLAKMNEGRALDDQFTIDEVVLSPEEIQRAEETAQQVNTNVFYGNMAVLAPTNMIAFARPLLKIEDAVRPGYKTAINSAGKHVDGIDLLGPVQKKLATAGRYLEEPAKNLVTEGFQEFSQYGITEAALDLQASMLSNASTQEILEASTRIGAGKQFLGEFAGRAAEQIIDQTNDKEALHQALVGALVGAVSGGFRTKSSVKDKEAMTQRDVLLKNLDPVFTRLGEKAQYANGEQRLAEVMNAAKQSADQLREAAEAREGDVKQYLLEAAQEAERTYEQARRSMSQLRAMQHLDNKTDDWYREDLVRMMAMPIQEFKKLIGADPEADISTEDQAKIVQEQLDILDKTKKTAKQFDLLHPTPDVSTGIIGKMFLSDEELDMKKKIAEDHQRYRNAVLFSSQYLDTKDNNIVSGIEKLKEIFPDISDELIEELKKAGRTTFGEVTRDVDGKEVIDMEEGNTVPEVIQKIKALFDAESKDEEATLKKQKEDNELSPEEQDKKATEQTKYLDEAKQIRTKLFNATTDEETAEALREYNEHVAKARSNNLASGFSAADRAAAQSALERLKESEVESPEVLETEAANPSLTEVEKKKVALKYGPLGSEILDIILRQIRQDIFDRDVAVTAYNNLLRDPKERDLYLSRLKAVEKQKRERAVKTAVDTLIKNTKTAAELEEGRKNIEESIQGEFYAKYSKVLDEEHKKRLNAESEEAKKRAGRSKQREGKRTDNRKKRSGTKTQGGKKGEGTSEQQALEREQKGLVTSTRTTAAGQVPSGQFTLVPIGKDADGKIKYGVQVDSDGKPFEGNRNRGKTVNGEPVINGRHILATPEIKSGVEVSLEVIETDWWKENKGDYVGREAANIPVFITYTKNGEKFVIAELAASETPSATRTAVYKAFQNNENGSITTTVKAKGSGYVFAAYEAKNGQPVKPHFYPLNTFDKPILAVVRVDEAATNAEGGLVLDVGQLSTDYGLTQEEVDEIKNYAATTTTSKFTEGQVVMIEKNAAGEYKTIAVHTSKIDNDAVVQSILQSMADNDTERLENLIGLNKFYHFENLENLSAQAMFMESMNINGTPTAMFIFKPLGPDGKPLAGLADTDFIRISANTVRQIMSGQEISKETLTDIEYQTLLVRLSENEEGGINMKGTSRRYETQSYDTEPRLIEDILAGLDTYLENAIRAKRYQVDVNMINDNFDRTIISPIGNNEKMSYMEYLSLGLGDNGTGPIVGANTQRVNKVNGKGGSTFIDIGLELNVPKGVFGQNASSDTASNAKPGKPADVPQDGNVDPPGNLSNVEEQGEALLDQFDFDSMSSSQRATWNRNVLTGQADKNIVPTPKNTKKEETLEGLVNKAEEKKENTEQQIEKTDTESSNTGRMKVGKEGLGGAPFSLQEKGLTSREEAERMGEEFKKRCKGQ
jgi:hypothetical protein